MSERIIIAEDDEHLAFVLREAPRRQRYDTDVAPTAGGLLDGLKAAPYDLLLPTCACPTWTASTPSRAAASCRRTRPSS